MEIPAESRSQAISVHNRVTLAYETRVPDRHGEPRGGGYHNNQNIIRVDSGKNDLVITQNEGH